MLGRQGDKVETFERATEYLRNPPARLIMTIDEAAHKIGAEYGEALRALARFDSEGESNGNPASESE